MKSKGPGFHFWFKEQFLQGFPHDQDSFIQEILSG